MNMLSLLDLFSSILKYKIYPINFPEYQEGDFVKVEITSGVKEAGGVYDFNIQFMVKSKHPSDSERISLDIIEKLDMLTNKDFGNGVYQLILAKATSPQPFYVGETEINEYIFSADFRLLVNKL